MIKTLLEVYPETNLDYFQINWIVPEKALEQYITVMSHSSDTVNTALMFVQFYYNRRDTDYDTPISKGEYILFDELIKINEEWIPFLYDSNIYIKYYIDVKYQTQLSTQLSKLI